MNSEYIKLSLQTVPQSSVALFRFCCMLLGNKIRQEANDSGGSLLAFTIQHLVNCLSRTVVPASVRLDTKRVRSILNLFRMKHKDETCLLKGKELEVVVLCGLSSCSQILHISNA